jgi:hypothetical protein
MRLAPASRGVKRVRQIRVAMRRKPMMKKISLGPVAAFILAISHLSHAQQPAKVPRIGYLSNGDPATESTRSEGIRLALRELGHIEGQNIAI